MPLKKLFIMTHNLLGGGTERALTTLANAFFRDGVEVSILTEYASPCAYPLDPGIRVIPLTERTTCRSRDIFPVYRRLRRLVKAERPDAVLALPEKVNVWTVLFLLGSGTPVVVSERNDPSRHPESRIKRLLRKLIYPCAGGFIFQTERQAAYFSPSIRRRATVLDNPLDTAALPAPFAGERNKTVVSAGRLEPQKNFPLLITAFAAFLPAHPGWKLIIYGEGSLREALAEQSKRLGLTEAILLPGRSERLAQDMREAGMFVLPSDFEGLPNALIEAMALSLPVIATDCPCGGPASLIRSGENGLLTPVGDAAALAQAMAHLAADPALAKRLGAAAYGVRNRLALKSVAGQWRAYIARVIG